jgi:hypothetical protein
MVTVERRVEERPLDSGIGRGYVDWPAIFAGVVIATAISLLLLSFGSAIGLSLTSAYEGRGISFLVFAICAALWLIWVQVSGFFAGGYAVGRLRQRSADSTENESDLRDGMHGLVVWGLGLLMGAILSFASASQIADKTASVVNATGTAIATATDGAADAGASPSVLSLLESSIGVPLDRMFRPDENAAAGNTTQPSSGSVGVTDDLRSEVLRLTLSEITREQIDDADRRYLTTVVARQAGISADAANARVTAFLNEVKSPWSQPSSQQQPCFWGASLLIGRRCSVAIIATTTTSSPDGHGNGRPASSLPQRRTPL